MPNIHRQEIFPSKLDQRFRRAAERGDKDVVEDLLGRGADLLAADNRSGYTALHLSAINNHVEVVELLLFRYTRDTGAEKDRAMPRLGYTALHLAAIKGHLKVVERLLLERVNTESVDSQGRTALVLAAKFDHTEVVEALFHAGVKTDATIAVTATTEDDEDGHSVLASAASNCKHLLAKDNAVQPS